MKRKRHLKRNLVIILIALGLIGLTISLTTGGSEQGEALAQESQRVTVQRGDLSLEITAAGNLELSHIEDLSIDLFYPEGTIEEVLVEEGDTVEEGQVLVKLDMDEWNDELNTLEEALTTAQRNVTSKQSALAKAERQVITLERQVADKESAVTEAERAIAEKEFNTRQAELNLQTAENNLGQIEEVKEAQDDVEAAEDNLHFIKKVISNQAGLDITDISYWTLQKANAEDELEWAEEDLQEILEGTSLSLTDDVTLEITKKQLLVEQAKLNLEDAEIAVANAKKAVDDAKYALESARLDVEDAEQAVEDARLNVEDTEQDLTDAEEELADARSKSPEIKATFAGFVTKINVKGGDEVMKGTVAVQIADPNKFEAEILVSEIDISKVELGGEALVQVEALDLTLPATVTHIAPTATISSGVVNYSVTIEVQSTEAESSQLTAGDENAENADLREGMTVALSLIVSQRSDVLLVPYTAITSEGEQKYVQVVSPDGTIENRAVTTGITDYQYTEVTEGLSEGEQVLMSGTVITATSESVSDEEQSPGGGMMIPGMMDGGGPGGEPPSGGPPGG